MPNLNKTEIAVIMDRSGSMESIKHDMAGGFVNFIAEQAKVPGELRVSLYQFDTEFDVVFEERYGDEVKAIELVPRGGTALYQAILLATDRIGKRLAAKAEQDRPGAVIVLVITDGEENASPVEFSHERVKQVIKHQEGAYNWRFAYLGASEAGLAQERTAFVAGAAVGFVATTKGVCDAYQSTSQGVTSYRSAVASNNIGASLNISGDSDK